MQQDVFHIKISLRIRQTDYSMQIRRNGKCQKVNLPHDHGQNIEKVLERMPDTDECVVVAEVFKQISDGSRIRILWLLCHCEECVSNIAAAMNMSDPAVSHHLKLLKRAAYNKQKRR